MGGLPPICHRFSEKIPKNMKRGLNIAELCYADSVIPALNVMRRILEYYFLQLWGYEGSNLREERLEKEENKKKFIVEIPGSEPDMTKYQLASTMLAYINNPNGISIMR